jgi:large subunit ribosomal protein L25
MIKDITINASARDGVGKGYARRLRAEGKIPASIYGEGKESAAIAVNAKEIANILRSDTGHNTIFKLALPNGGEADTVIIKDYQVDPIKGRLMHADLMRLSLTEKTRVRVSVELKGESIGVKRDGGILEFELREVEIECLPTDIPEHLTVDVSALELGDHVTVANLMYDSEKVTVLTDEHQVIAGVFAPRLAEAPAAVEGEAAASEPEVIKKGKTEE